MPRHQGVSSNSVTSGDVTPVDFDTVVYTRRIVVERCFNRFKHWRALATRYDKHAVV